MIESIWVIFTMGFLMGAPSGISPGPMLILIISEAMRHGIRAGVKVAIIPLLTDLPVVLSSGFLFTQISEMNFLLGVISLIGFVFLFYLGSKNIRSANVEISDYTPPPLLLKEIIFANLLNPNPYLFWFTVGAPLMVRSFQQTLILGVVFLFSFYLGLVGIKIMLAIVAEKSRSFLQGIWYRRIMQFLGFTLIVFAFYMLRDCLIYFDIYQH